jgi:trehalose/maltose hydrolase-like predicted phosphorylase
MMLEIARFWGSIAHHDADRDRYEIHGVMGPDEFHEKYPGAAEGGLRNNAYTNVMVSWICDQAMTVLGLLTERRRDTLRAKIGLGDEEIAKWDEMSRKMYVPFHGDGIISQFEGYEELEELDWEGYRERHGNIQRLDRILRAEDDDPDRYKLAKQADTVLLFFLFSPEEIRRRFERLGYDWDAGSAARNIEYYDRRTSHGSTLSYIAHAGVLAPLDPEHSWERFLVALESDVGDVQGGTTKEGIHLGVMAGTVDLVQRAYTGAEIRDGVLYFAPTLTDRLDGMVFPMQVRGTPIRVSVRNRELTVVITGGFSRPIKVGIGDDVRELGAGERCTFKLGAPVAVGADSDGGA